MLQLHTLLFTSRFDRLDHQKSFTKVLYQVGETMIFNLENRMQSGMNESMMNHFVGSVDLTGAELEFAGCCVNVTSGKLGHFDPKRRQVSGSLSIVSSLKPSLLASLVRIHWRNQEFEVIMISLKETTVKNELTLKFVARVLSSESTAVV